MVDSLAGSCYLHEFNIIIELNAQIQVGLVS